MDGLLVRSTLLLFVLAIACWAGGCTRSILRQTDERSAAARPESVSTRHGLLPALQRRIRDRIAHSSQPPAATDDERAEALPDHVESQGPPLQTRSVAFEQVSESPLDHVSASAPQSNSDSGRLVAAGRQRLRYAEDLARRGAHFAAREQTISVLRMVATLHDARQKSNAHIEGINAGLTALEEVEDFSEIGHRGATVLSISAGHRSSVLNLSAADEMSAVEAIQVYCNVAIRCLVDATEGEPLASDALYLLGRITELQAQRSGDGQPELTEHQTLVCYHAAFLICPNHHAVANELGVLLARRGQLTLARRSLEQSVESCPLPQNCRNLALVLEQSGQASAAEHYMQMSKRLAGSPDRAKASQSSIVRWVDPSELAQSQSDMTLTAGVRLPANGLPGTAIHDTDPGDASRASSPQK